VLKVILNVPFVKKTRVIFNCTKRHRKFLPRNYPYRRMKKAFNGSPEDEVVARPRNGEEIYNQVENIDIMFGKHRKRPRRKAFRRNDQSSLIFHIGVNLRYDIV